ncbi:Xenotropic and polytropic retrovirus receptor 1-like [Mizuhopecten yessoensis]|uniref:Xenotropic and polytropic retrovirus receptor 1-like n=1 Tax=Mizuhopecten yessoensis TaxID=6573 RepID=A0A210Q718_MIZYE|nr:Xenotropic and polytropic retrovirus receptor 1-like [Mizuhopecten yessoensis]
MVEDFVLRFAWTLTVSIGEGGYFPGEALKTLLASLEVFRRFVWNFFRLENEHLNNCGQFRAVRDISIAPIDSNDQTQLEDMMDQEDGAYTCRSERKRLMGNKSSTSLGRRRSSVALRLFDQLVWD